MADVTVTQYFPCAKAPFDEGKHRLWTEANITDIFSFIFDVNTSETPLVNYDGTKLLVGGYMFTGTADTFVEGTSYWIFLDNGELEYDANAGNGELEYDANAGRVRIYSGTKPSDEEGKTIIGGPAQRLKFTQPSIGNIDLQPQS